MKKEISFNMKQLKLTLLFILLFSFAGKPAFAQVDLSDVPEGAVVNLPSEDNKVPAGQAPGGPVESDDEEDTGADPDNPDVDYDDLEDTVVV